MPPYYGGYNYNVKQPVYVTEHPFHQQTPINIDDIINHIHDIKNSITTIATVPDTDTHVDGDNFVNINDAIEAVGAGNGSGSVGDAVTEVLNPSFLTTLSDGTASEVTTAKVNIAVDEDDSVFGTISTTIRNILESDENESQGQGGQDGQFQHKTHHDLFDHKEESNPYLALIVVLAILVILATVALILYIRHKKLSSPNNRQSISVLGKNFQKFGDSKPSAEKKNVSQEQTNYGGCEDIQEDVQEQDNKMSQQIKDVR